MFINLVSYNFAILLITNIDFLGFLTCTILLSKEKKSYTFPFQPV